MYLWSGELLCTQAAGGVSTHVECSGQVPVKALGLVVHVWGLYLHLLSLGLRALLLCPLLLPGGLSVCVRRRAGLCSSLPTLWPLWPMSVVFTSTSFLGLPGLSSWQGAG